MRAGVYEANDMPELLSRYRGYSALPHAATPRRF